MAQINQERENKFFEILGQLKSEFYNDLGCKYRQGYWLNNSFLDVVRDGDYRPVIGMPVCYPILNRCIGGDGCRFTIAELEKAIENLFRGIENNVDLMSGLQQERYIYSLLVPFSGLCGIELEAFIKRANTWPSYIGDISREKYEKMHRISGAVVFVGPLIGSDNLHYAIDGDGLKDVCTEQEKQEVADVLFEMYYNVLLFKYICNEVGQRLDALLLEKGINLLWYQNQCGVQLVGKRNNIMALARYIGTPELASKYIVEALPKIDDVGHGTASTPTQNAADIWSTLPEKLQTNEAKKIFERAIDAGFMTITSNGAKWNNEKQLLAYFASKMSDRFHLQKRVTFATKEKQTSWKPFEELFDVKDLKSARADCMKNHQGYFEPDKSKEIDKLFE